MVLMGRSSFCLLIALAGSTSSAVQKPAKQTFVFGGESRPYLLLTPKEAAAVPVPLIILLHGSGRDGNSQMSAWQNLGRDEGVALAAPDSLNRQSWSLGTEGPDYFQALVEAVKKHLKVDDRRVYLFGHSAGGHHSIAMGLLESGYFAAVAAHAGALSQAQSPFLKQAYREIPFALWQGTDDRIVPVAAARVTRDALKSVGLSVELTEIRGHTHDYYSRADRINKEVWAFLKQHTLTADPVYREYKFGR